jgi:hypothetical protein
MELEEFFTTETETDPENIIKVGVTNNFFAENRFKSHPLRATRNVYIQFSQLLTSAKAHYLENLFHQTWKAPIYKNFTLTGFDSKLDGFSEMYNFAKPVSQKIIGQFNDMRYKLDWAKHSKDLQETYYGLKFEHEHRNIVDPTASVREYHCMKFYIAFFPIKGSDTDLEIETKKKESKEAKIAKAAK